MKRIPQALRGAFRHSWRVVATGLLVTSPIIYAAFHVQLNPETYQLVMRSIEIISQPWMSLADLVMIKSGNRLIHTDLLAALCSVFVSINLALLYVLLRFGWLLLRPNNSFKPNPLRGSA
jgi:hypothetical protein